MGRWLPLGRMSEAATVLYGYAEIERVLPISFNTKNKLDELSELHDKVLNWSDPAGPSPWKRALPTFSRSKHCLF